MLLETQEEILLKADQDHQREILKKDIKSDYLIKIKYLYLLNKITIKMRGELNPNLF
jgi:hypothetical protein